MTKLFTNAYARLVGRALVAGLTAALTMLSTASDLSAAWRGAVVGGVLAFVEFVTPLNQKVGPSKAGG